MDIVSLITRSLEDKALQAERLAKINTAPSMINAVAGANLTNVQAKLLPGESAANVLKTGAETKRLGAETGLIGETTKYFGKEALARIRQMNTGSDLTVTNNKIATREGLTESGRWTNIMRAMQGLPTM